jgi:hypothetical protein
MLTTDNHPTLYLRRPGNDAEEIIHFDGDDPFLSEMAAVIERIEGADTPILSSYADGELWQTTSNWIRLQSELIFQP